MKAVEFAELNALAGELLPERTVLSTVVNNVFPSAPAATPAASNASNIVVVPAAADHPSQVMNGCHSDFSPGGESSQAYTEITPVDDSYCGPMWASQG